MVCNKSDNTPSNLMVPECIDVLLEDSLIMASMETIRVQVENEEHHYWLNTDARHADGIEFIVNSKCDTVCALCAECIPPDCSKDYEEDEWMIIWEK